MIFLSCAEVIFNDVKTENWAISGELFSETLKKSN
jgi:4-oxalocrotonate tautomerase